MSQPPAEPLRPPQPGAEAWLGRARSAFAGCRVAVVGDAILDCYRHADGTSACYAGGAAVIAGHLKALGAEPVLVTLTARDGDTAQLLRCLEAMDVGHEAMPVRAALPTRVREVRGEQIVARRRLELILPPPAETVGRIAGAVAELRTQLDAAIFVDFGYGTVTPALLDGLLPTLRPAVKFLAGDVSGPRASLLSMRRFDLLTPTEAELRRLTPTPTPATPLHPIAHRLRRELELSHLLVTRDRHGGVRYDAEDRSHPFASAATTVVDEVGAGDALLAAMTLAMTCAASPEAATRFGQWAAAAALARLGNAPVGWDAIRRAADQAAHTSPRTPSRVSARPAA
ncbi:MAG: PfkB family carbohydrate kinase [Planctomycetota bacterium]